MSFPHTYGCVWRNAKRNNKFWNYPLCASIVKILPSETHLPRRRYVSNVFARPSFYRWFHFDFYYEQKKMLLLKLSPDATCTPVYKLWVTEQKFQWYGHLCLFRIHARPFGEMPKKNIGPNPSHVMNIFWKFDLCRTGRAGENACLVIFSNNNNRLRIRSIRSQ